MNADRIVIAVLTGVLNRLAQLEAQGVRTLENVTAFKNFMTSALAESNLRIDNIVKDEAGLTATILELQAAIANNPASTLSAEDQAALDEIATEATALRDRLTSVDAAVEPPVSA